MPENAVEYLGRSNADRLARMQAQAEKAEAEVARLNGIVTGLRCAYRDLRTLAQWIADGYNRHPFPDAVARLLLRRYPDPPPSEAEIERLRAIRDGAASDI